MKKTLVSSLLVSAIVLGASLPAFAASEGVTENEDRSISSTSKVTLKGGNKDKTDPEEPNIDGGETGQAGPLSIDQVLNFNFVETELGSGTLSIPLITPKGSSAKRTIQVTDKRGTGAGWNLQVKQSDLVSTNTEGEKRTLKGAYIQMNNPKITGSLQNNPEAAALSMVSYQPNGSNKGEYARVLSAGAEQGMGTWKAAYNDTQDTANKPGTGNIIKLVIPTGNYAGSYQGNVTWALYDGPEGQTAFVPE